LDGRNPDCPSDPTKTSECLFSAENPCKELVYIKCIADGEKNHAGLSTEYTPKKPNPPPLGKLPYPTF
jgi:hypothetical protein